MRKNHIAATACVMGAFLGLAGAAQGIDGQAAYEQRRDTMKAMGRAFYLGIGRVVKGRAEYSAATVAAADSLPPLVAKISTLFPPGSDVADSKMKPALLAAPDEVAKLASAVQAATPALVDAVKSGDRARIAAAYAKLNDACSACHNDYRTEEDQ